MPVSNPDLTSVANVCSDYDKEKFSAKTTWRDICWIVKLEREGKWEVMGDGRGQQMQVYRESQACIPLKPSKQVNRVFV